jgi:hypothetical protein
VALLAAAAFSSCRRRHHHQQHKQREGARMSSQLEIPLLNHAGRESIDGCTSVMAPTANTSVFANTSATAQAATTQHTSASASMHGDSVNAAPVPAAAVASRAEFASVGGTGFPVNAAAKQQVSNEWASGEAFKVRRLEYTALVKATDGFSALCRIGGGGSCVVYRAQVSAIKHQDHHHSRTTPFSTH